MNLWLLRHGEAESNVIKDEMRELTERGVQAVQQTAMLLQKQRLDLILHSPLVRAQQTANIVCDVIAYSGKKKQVDWIIPESDPKMLVNQLDQYSEQHILIVSHQPLLGKLVSLLTEGSQQNPYPFRTAELVCLEGDMVCIGDMSLK